jgi:uncharacterized protein (DUF1015 family)
VAQIRPFSGIRYASRLNAQFASMIAPPYDVLDEPTWRTLQDRHPHNIVHVDLPFMPPKEAGPDEVYERANDSLQAWLAAGVLHRDPRPSIYPYTQTYKHSGRTFHRRGLIALVKLSPFGEGEVVPHELTYKGPIQDRLKLMQHTGMQLSPIFGLFSDPRHEITNLVYKDVSRPEFSGMLGNVQNDLWHINDAKTVSDITALFRNRPVYIADGHHRYTTALQYQQLVSQNQPLPPNHPANYCMFVLVGMQDPGLLILPTHRLIGGMSGFDINRLRAAFGSNVVVDMAQSAPGDTAALAEQVAHSPVHTFGLYDGKSRKSFLLKLTNPSILADLEPKHSQAWRELDVAILQRYFIDTILQPTFCGGADPALGYSADASTIPQSVDGAVYQIALLLKPTPLHALEQLGKTNEVMPQKSTYFFPKLATGMAMYPLK